MMKKVNGNHPAIKRLMKELQQFQDEPSPDFTAAPLEDNLLEWHFTLRGPPDSEFDGGIYHGKILLPDQYPFKPPDIIMLTPSGRFDVNTKICLSITGFHPKSWQPSWGIRTALIAIRAFFPSKPKGAIGSLDYPKAERQKLAVRSAEWKCHICNKSNRQLLEENITIIEEIKNKEPQQLSDKGSTISQQLSDSSSDEKLLTSDKEILEELKKCSMDPSTTTQASATSEAGGAPSNGTQENKQSSDSALPLGAQQPAAQENALRARPAAKNNPVDSLNVHSGARKNRTQSSSKNDSCLSLLTVVLMICILLLVAKKVFFAVTRDPFAEQIKL